MSLDTKQKSGESKAAKIRALFKEGRTDAEIAKLVGCGQAYVRTVRQRQMHNGETPSMVRWREQNSERYKKIKLASWHKRMADPDYRARHREQQKHWRDKNGDRIRQAERERYANDPVYRAKKIASVARSKRKRAEREASQ